jgi:hypothetical protein
MVPTVLHCRGAKFPIAPAGYTRLNELPKIGNVIGIHANNLGKIGRMS